MTARWLHYLVHGTKPARRARRSRMGYKGPARSSKYKAWIRTLGCCLCGAIVGIEAAHTGSDGGMRLKASDYSCIPLCGDCHTAATYSYHRDREAFTARLYTRLRMTVEQLVRELNREWHAGRMEAA